MTPRLTPERVRELLAAAPHDSGDPADVRIIVDGPRELARRKMALCVASEALARDVLAMHDALARVTRERDAAVAARDALVTAVHVVRVAHAATTAAGARYGAAWDAVDAMPPTALQSEGIAAALRTSYEAQETLEAALTALLDGAPADVVRGDVVRAYLAAADAYDTAGLRVLEDDEVDDITESEARDAARAALDAALAAGGGR